MERANTCPACYGAGVVEIGGGKTIKCAVCDGKGHISS